MTSCKEIKDKEKTKFPLKIKVELVFDSDFELERVINKIRGMSGTWSYEDELLDILESK